MMPSPLERVILSTLAYYHALGRYPLTSFELYLRLNACGERPTFLQLLRTLESLCKEKTIIATNGFFFLNFPPSLSSNKNPVRERIRRYKISEGKWKKLERALRWLILLPYVRMIGVTGSLAINNSREESDIDLLVVTKPGRIWTSRILCSLVTQLLGMRRYHKKIRDRVCLNYYLSSNALTLTVQNLSNAHAYASMIPILDRGGWYQRFHNENQWIDAYISSSRWGLHRSLRYIKKSVVDRFLNALFEILLQNPIGDLLEKIFELFQKRKILSSIPPHHVAKTDQLLLSSNALMFHYPISRNVEVEEKYKKEIKRLGLGVPRKMKP